VIFYKQINFESSSEEAIKECLLAFSTGNVINLPNSSAIEKSASISLVTLVNTYSISISVPYIFLKPRK
jgi:hypothetical protein